MTIKKMKNYNKQKGFSLIIIIIAILIITVIAFGFMNQKGQIKQNQEIKSKATMDLKKINENLKKENQAIQNILEDKN